MQKIKLLIIGVNGFIGRHCADYFSTLRSVDLWGCDISPEKVSNYLQLNPLDPDFESIFLNHKFDICINCSGAANVPLSLENPLFDFELNTLNVFKILEAIKNHCPSCKFLNLSSAAVYGNPLKLPVTEETTSAPVSPYGYHKLMAEMICREFYTFWKVPTLSLRIFSAYGPGLKKQIFWDLSQKLKSKPPKIELFGTGNETRDFIYISDLVRLIGIVIFKADFDGSVLNAANGTQVSIKDIACAMRDSISPQTQVCFCGSIRKGDPLNWEADIEKIKNLGYSSSISIDNGIKLLLEWLKENELL